MRPWDRLLWEAVGAPSLKVLKSSVGGTLGSLIWWVIPLPMEGGLELSRLWLWVQPNSNHSNYSIVLWFYGSTNLQFYKSIYKGEVKPSSLCLFICERNLSPKTHNLLLYHCLSLDMIDLFLKDEHDKWFSYFNFFHQSLPFSRYL